MYGYATAKLVSIFQRDRRLQSSGEVDEPTAGALNNLLSQWGLLETASAPTFRIVTGALRREDGLPLQGVLVRAMHQADGGGYSAGGRYHRQGVGT